MTPPTLRTLAALAAAGTTLLSTPLSAHAIDPVFVESFENCVDPVGEPSYTEYATATAAAEPIKVNLWIDELINCDGWDADGQAWMTTYSSGGDFPDGTHAAWLNEGDDYSVAPGTISREITGLTADHDYELILETWTDDQDAATALTVTVTNGTDVQELTYDLDAGEGIQALSNFFSAYGDTITLELVGSDATYASPLVDNIRIVDAGLTAERQDTSGGGTSNGSSSLAKTGFDASSTGGVAAALFAAGLALVGLRRRTSRH